MDNVGWVTTGSDEHHDVRIHEACPRVSIDQPERQELEFDTATTEATIFTSWRGHKGQLHRKENAKI